MEIDDQELLAGLEAQEAEQQHEEEEEVVLVERLPVNPVEDSGYRTISQFSALSCRSSTIRSLSASSSRWVDCQCSVLFCHQKLLRSVATDMSL